MVATDIRWNTDSSDELNKLPAKIEIPAEMTDEDSISDYLSDITGFCHKGFRLVEDL